MGNLCQKVAIATAATVAIASLLGDAKLASAQSVAICQSIDYEPATCSIDTEGGVVLIREYSQASCRGNWGYEDGFVWVENGCRAQFRARYWDEYDERYDNRYERRGGRSNRRHDCRSYCQ